MSGGKEANEQTTIEHPPYEEYIKTARMIDGVFDETKRILVIAQTLKLFYERGRDAGR